MSELTRARDTPSADSLDSLERAQWDDITKGVETLKVDDDTKPPTDSSPPIKSDDESVAGEMALNCKIVGLKHKVKTLTKENKDLKREIEEMKKSAPPPTASSPSASDPVYLRYTVNNGQQKEVHYVCIDDEEELELFHEDDAPGNWWDYEDHLDLQLDYADCDMEGDYEVITKEVWEENKSIRDDDCLIRDIKDDDEESA